MASLSSRHQQLKTDYRSEFKSIKTMARTPEPGRTDFLVFPQQIVVLRHRCGGGATALNLTWEKEVLIVLFSNIKDASSSPRKQKQARRRKKHEPDILASVTINLLLTAFNVISSHMFQMCLCFRPLKTNGFFSELFTPDKPPNTHTHTQVHTHKNNSSAALSLKDVTLTFSERYFWILAHTSCSVARRNGDKHLYVHTPPHTELMIDFTQIAEETNWHLNTLIQVWKHTHNHTRKNLPV